MVAVFKESVRTTGLVEGLKMRKPQRSLCGSPGGFHRKPISPQVNLHKPKIKVNTLASHSVEDSNRCPETSDEFRQKHSKFDLTVTDFAEPRQSHEQSYVNKSRHPEQGLSAISPNCR